MGTFSGDRMWVTELFPSSRDPSASILPSSRDSNRAMGIVKLRLTAAFGAQYGGFATDWSPVSWGSLDELFVNLTIPLAESLLENEVTRDALRKKW